MIVWQSVFSQACRSIVGGAIKSHPVPRSIFIVPGVLRLVWPWRERHPARFTWDSFLNTDSVGVDGIVRVGGRDCNLIDDDQVSGFSSFGDVRGATHDVCDARDLSHVRDPGQVSMDHPLQSDVSHHREFPSRVSWRSNPLECLGHFDPRDRSHPGHWSSVVQQGRKNLHGHGVGRGVLC